MVTKRHFYESKHPFDDYSFEALCSNSWQPVENISIRNGIMTLNFVDKTFVINGKGPYSNLRLRSRRATLSDCTCFLRPGVDICVLSTSQCAENSDNATQEPEWMDARISSIERKPHERRCSCRFYVNFYVNQGPLGVVREKLSKEITEVRIDQISILQKLGLNFSEDHHYRWDFSEDCSIRQKTKLLLGKILSDLSWLLITSVLKNVAFVVRSVQHKIVYQISGCDDGSSSSNSSSSLHAVNFREENGVLIPKVVQFVPIDLTVAVPMRDEFEAEPPTISGLRRSKRRNVQPERFLGCDSSVIDIGHIRSRPYKIYHEKDDEMSLPLAQVFGLNASSSEEDTESEQEFLPKKKKSSSNPNANKRKAIFKKQKSGEPSRKKHQSELAIVPYVEKGEASTSKHNHYQAKSPPNYAKENPIRQLPPEYYYIDYNPKPRKKTSQFEDMELGGRWDKKSFRRRIEKKRQQHRSMRPMNSRGERICQKRSLSAGAYNDLINAAMKQINFAMKQEPPIIDQWKEIKNKTSFGHGSKTEPLSNEDEEEMSELDKLWKEMDLVIASTYLLDDNENPTVGSLNKAGKRSRASCQHDFKIDEEIGVLCRLCGFVASEIKHVTPPFAQNTSWAADEKRHNVDDLDQTAAGDDQMDHLWKQSCPDGMSSEQKDNVWDLIPELGKKLHLHQQKAFEFLWKNIAGSVKPEEMQPKSKKIGGCVISHAPGAGKTFLIIAFLVSYLKLFPGKRPLVIAPKTTLYTWYKEFIKWRIPVPVHLIHGRRTYRAFRQKSVVFPGGPRPTDDVMHILDCVEKIKMWHSEPSVLVMGYTSFLSMMRDQDSRFLHRRVMAKVFRESPGLLILDEGHNPRSTKSRLRKVLMKAETQKRILLSGTLFQNNFCEYFNTLCLARPQFIDEVLKALDPKFKRKKTKLVDKARHLLEARARKFFLDKIAKKIDSNVGRERMQGLRMLRKITNGFIDVYEGGEANTLPGLQIYTLLMNSTDKQHEMLVRLHEIMSTYNGFPLELELLITLGSIHPWLIKTANCAHKFFSDEELMDLEKYKYDLRKGSKVKFVLNLIFRVCNKEKVLIFCHNIAPVKLFVELFEKVFKWKRGQEILVLTGDLELFERGRVMDKFEEAGGPSKILLASITACAEGISLTAASRVILLDSEWNPSKTKQAIARAFRPGQQKVVYVYQLLATGTLEEDKHSRTTWKEWVSSMIFSEAFVEDPSKWQAEKIEDETLREMVAEDKSKSFHMIMKNEKASTLIR
ncbi:hypothetical protein UlMin_025419, partial [Ulmus minor]